MVGMPASAAPPGVLSDPVVEAALEGDSGGFHYEFDFLGTEGSEALHPNAAVEVRVYDADDTQLGVCNFGEDTLGSPSSLTIGPGLRAASFTGTVPFGSCLALGNATFDLDWVGTGGMSTYTIPSRGSDEVCVELGKRRLSRKNR